MRLAPLFTSLVVALVLYLFIMERDALKAWANGPEVEAEIEEIAAVEPKDPPVSVVAMISEAREVAAGLVLSGRTEAARNVEVKSETTGLVISDPIRKGNMVSEGQVLCELDAGTRQATLAEARARLAEAQANNNAASQLVERGYTSETTAIARKAALESAQAMVEQAEKELARLKIHAPFDGILESDTAELGDLLQTGSPCATVISLDPIKIVGYVPEISIDRLKVGTTAGARLVTGQEVVGLVSFISRSADDLTRTFRIEVEVPNRDFSIKDGVTAEIVIALDGEKAHLLPQSVLTLNDEGALGIRANEDGVAQFLPVRVVRDDPEGIWVSGLPDSVEVIVVGQDFVREGRAINVTYRAEDNEAGQ